MPDTLAHSLPDDADNFGCLVEGCGNFPNGPAIDARLGHFSFQITQEIGLRVQQLLDFHRQESFFLEIGGGVMVQLGNAFQIPGLIQEHVFASVCGTNGVHGVALHAIGRKELEIGATFDLKLLHSVPESHQAVRFHIASFAAGEVEAAADAVDDRLIAGENLFARKGVSLTGESDDLMIR